MKIWKYLFFVLTIIAIFVWISVFTTKPKNVLQLVACDVGQGDAILVSFGETQILTDGGPGSKVLTCLENHMSIQDRTIELVILTNPDKDHYGGLIEVFKRYQVKSLLANSFDKSGQDFGVLKSLVGGTTTQVLYPQAGMVIRLGLISLDVLWPNDAYYSSELQNKENKKSLGALPVNDNPNNLSIVTILKFDDFEALLTGDIEEETSDVLSKKIISNYSNTTIEYLKVPHHGSTNGLTQKLLEVVKPKVAVISVGVNNSYGHPRQEILDMLGIQGVLTQRTDLNGEIIVEVNESGWSLKE